MSGYDKTSNVRGSGTPAERGSKFQKQGHRQHGDMGKRQRKQGGRPSGRQKLSGKFSTSGLRKVTARQAYGADEKKAWFNRQRPLIETKKLDSRTVYQDVSTYGDPGQTFLRDPDNDQLGYIVPNDNGILAYTVPFVYHIQLLPFWYAPSRRLVHASGSSHPRTGYDMLTGKTRFISHMRTKIRITLPSQAYRPFGLGYASHGYRTGKMYIVHGWIKDAPNWADRGDANANSKRPWPDSIPAWKQAWRRNFLDYTNWIRRNVDEWFQQARDPLRFISKRKSRLKIMGYMDLDKLQDKTLNYNTITDGRGTSVVGTKDPATGPIINYTADFGDIYRKVHYTLGQVEQPSGQGGGTRPGYNFPNSSTWTPFCVVYTPDAAKWTESLEGGNAIIKVTHNTQCWYSEG
jgi:hypothetical protein